uniref:Uncharacterized protein n=1 Tax=Ascaris lumbricoides TaxID=6252 RepID=A0A0M3IKZ3_ASCLU
MVLFNEVMRSLADASCERRVSLLASRFLISVCAVYASVFHF